MRINTAMVVGLVERRQDRSFMTAYVVDGLTMASGAGFQIDVRARFGREKLSAMLAAGKRDDGNPIDDETRAYMIYAYSESGESDGHLIEELYGNATSSAHTAARYSHCFYSNAKTAGRKKSASSHRGAAQRSSSERRRSLRLCQNVLAYRRPALV